MANYDVFNGDADGLCGLQQLHLAQPRKATLITGPKRDIQLLEKTPAGKDDAVTVLDVSLDSNRAGLKALLEKGAVVTYFDHHFAGDIPTHPKLTAHIDTAADTCTSLIVNKYLNGQFAAWAMVGAFGDNFDDSAQKLATTLPYQPDQVERLKTLGICLNYNGYGATLDDLHFHPDQLFQQLQPYADPLDFVRESPAFKKLHGGYEDDLHRGRSVTPHVLTNTLGIYVLPADPWGRRVSGVLANELAQSAPARAHAMLTHLPEGGFVVSVRAPLTTKKGADDLCRRFATGGGRKAAAGINHLPESDFDRFAQEFRAVFNAS